MRLVTLPATALALLVLHSAAAPVVLGGLDARMVRFPDVSATQIAFVHAGDIWVVPKAGGEAHRLSTPAGEELLPRFSPDGSRIAFSGNYDGNLDVYVVAAGGGVPERLTHHPGPDRVLDWYPDGRALLYASPMESGTNRFNQLYRLPAEGGMAAKLPVPYGEFGSISPDGRTLAYTPQSQDFRTWKRYRGGDAPDIWIFDLVDLTARKATETLAMEAQPMWHGTTLYFLSDRDEHQRNNLWAQDTRTGATKQVTFFTDYDVTFPAIGPSDIVFSAGSELYLLELASSATRKVQVTVVTDRASLKPRKVSVGKLLASGGISPSGKRVVLEARGEIFTVPAEHGAVLNLTRTSGVAERWPAWSPDGKRIAYFSDASGEYELTVRAADGSGAEERLSALGPGFRYDLFWSPDSTKLVFADQAMNINLYDLERKQLTPLDKGIALYEGGLQQFRVSWSADSRWIAWSRAVENRNNVIFIYDTREAKLHRVTSGFYDDAAPEFDPDGKYLYLLTGRAFDPVYSDLDNTWIYANTRQVAAVTLRRDVASPVAPRNDAEGEDDDETDESADSAAEGKEGAKADKKADKKAGKKAGGKAGKNGADEDQEDADDEKAKPVEIDLDGFEARLVPLPAQPGNYDGLRAVSGKLVYHRLPRTGSEEDAPSPIVLYDLEEREEQTILEDADAYAISASGEKLLVVKDDELAIVDVAADQELEKKLDLATLEMTLDPPAEWRQIFADAWRFERDYFYDPGLHGVDWSEMRRRYGALLDHAVTRYDVNFILGELIGELNSSHTYRGGGDTEETPERGVGLLGVDFVLDQGAYRIARILDGAVWDSEARSPLRQPGVDVKEGDYLLAVNGAPLDTRVDPWAAFDGLAGKTVALTVSARPELEGARQVLVETLGDDFRLRNLAWIEANRSKVAEATAGRVGYVYVPSTGLDGQNELVRMLRGQVDKEALIVDERFNSGGQIPDRFVELLNRPLYNYWAVRDGQDWPWPPVTLTGPKVMLINGWSGSGGDAFPFYFREAGLGPLIGTRTWGGLIGISGSPGLVDGGGVTVPTFSIYSTDGQWMIEGHGVEPDIEVIDDPSKMVRGSDPQLERAIVEVLERLRQAPPVAPKRPAYTDRSGS